MTAPFQVQRSSERGHFDHGWLETYHSFSFAQYYDPDNLNWGALRVFNDDRIAPGQGFATHPHRDMEILTYVLAGELEHRDSTGGAGVVRSGGVQFMSAGTGIRHSEYNHSPEHPLHLVQMWVLPGRYHVPPSYGQTDFCLLDRQNRWLTVASGQGGIPAPIALTQAATLRVARLETGGQLGHPIEMGRLGFLFVAEGEVAVEVASGGSDRVVLHQGDALRLLPCTITLTGCAELVLWDLPPLPPTT